MGAVGTFLLMLFDSPFLFYVGVLSRGISNTVVGMANRMWLLETFRPEEQLVGQAIFMSLQNFSLVFVGGVFYPIYFAYGYESSCLLSSGVFFSP